MHCPLSLSSHPVLVIGTTCKPQHVPTDVQTAFLHEVKIEAPSEEQRRLMLSMLTASLPLGKEVSLSKLARRTAVSETTAACGDGQAGSAGPISPSWPWRKGVIPTAQATSSVVNPGPQTPDFKCRFLGPMDSKPVAEVLADGQLC